MSERLVKAETFIVEMTCDADGCDGKMIPDGRCFPMAPPLYPHKCSECGREENYRQMYPVTRVVAVDEARK